MFGKFNRNEEKKMYEDKICSICKHKNDCPKNRVVIKEINEKASLICYQYEYEKL